MNNYIGYLFHRLLQKDIVNSLRIKENVKYIIVLDYKTNIKCIPAIFLHM